MNFRAFVKILKANGFTEVRVRGDHHQFEGYVGGKRKMVTVAYSRLGDDIKRNNLGSMIRQSGLDKKLFR